MGEARPDPEPTEIVWEAATDKRIRRQLNFLELAAIPTEQAGAERVEMFEDAELF